MSVFTLAKISEKQNWGFFCGSDEYFTQTANKMTWNNIVVNCY